MEFGFIQDPPPTGAATATSKRSEQLPAQRGRGFRMPGAGPRMSVEFSVNDLGGKPRSALICA
jgi:hypothetical protein